MLMWLAQWLQGLSPELGFLRVFQYLTLRAVLGAMTALLIGLLAGPAVIRRLTALQHRVPAGNSRPQPRRKYPQETSRPKPAPGNYRK